jgi:hypothetical protein
MPFNAFTLNKLSFKYFKLSIMMLNDKLPPLFRGAKRAEPV